MGHIGTDLAVRLVHPLLDLFLVGVDELFTLGGKARPQLAGVAPGDRSGPLSWAHSPPARPAVAEAAGQVERSEYFHDQPNAKLAFRTTLRLDAEGSGLYLLAAHARRRTSGADD